MRHYLAALATVGILAGGFTTAQQATLRKERTVVKEKDLVITRTYRGKVCVLYEMSRRGKISRGFLVNGKLAAAESDEDGSGLFRELTVFDPSSGDFECFTRTTNGLVVPMDSANLQALKKRKSDADQALGEALKEGSNY
jgi:hypothetical protein